MLVSPLFQSISGIISKEQVVVFYLGGAVRSAGWCRIDYLVSWYFIQVVLPRPKPESGLSTPTKKGCGALDIADA
jgi:hypothetical protein